MEIFPHRKALDGFQPIADILRTHNEIHWEKRMKYAVRDAEYKNTHFSFYVHKRYTFVYAFIQADQFKSRYIFLILSTLHCTFRMIIVYSVILE